MRFEVSESPAGMGVYSDRQVKVWHWGVAFIYRAKESHQHWLMVAHGLPVLWVTLGLVAVFSLPFLPFLAPDLVLEDIIPPPPPPRVEGLGRQAGSHEGGVERKELSF